MFIYLIIKISSTLCCPYLKRITTPVLGPISYKHSPNGFVLIYPKLDQKLSSYAPCKLTVIASGSPDEKCNGIYTKR